MRAHRWAVLPALLCLNCGGMIAGAAAGVVMNVIDIAANYVVVDNGLRQRLNAINPALWVQMNAPGRLIQYIAIDFIFALALVWLYAAIRPRFGPGPLTAVRAAIYDLQGRRVRSLRTEAGLAGRYRLTWNGDDKSGRRVTPGLYLFRLRIEGDSATHGQVRPVSVSY